MRRNCCIKNNYVPRHTCNALDSNARTQAIRYSVAVFLGGCCTALITASMKHNKTTRKQNVISEFCDSTIKFGQKADADFTLIETNYVCDTTLNINVHDLPKKA